MPVLVKNLGLDGFGKYSYILLIVGFAGFATDFGFSISGTKKISINRDNKYRVAKIFTSIIVAQIFVCLLIGLAVLVFAKLIFGEDDVIFTSLTVFALMFTNLCTPVWFFQGIERLDIVAKYQIMGRVVSLIMLFVFVKDASDLIIAALAFGIAQLFGIPALFTLQRGYRVLLLTPVTLRDIQQEISDGLKFFSSKAAISCFTYLIPVLLNKISGSESLAIYSAADKIRMAAQSVITPISQAVFPRINKLVSESKEECKKIILMSGVVIISISMFLSLVLFLFSNQIVNTLFNVALNDISNMLRLMCIIPLLTAISNILGLQIMVPFNMDKEFNLILWFAGVTSLLITYPLITNYEEVGAALAVVIAEGLVSLLMVSYILHVRKKLFFVN